MALAIFWFADGAAGHSPDEYVETDSGFADDAFGGSIKAASMVVSSPQARVILRNSIAGDRQAVEALFDATDGENWIDNSSWLSNRPLGAWFGITTNSKGRITAIELTDNQLEGQIPAEVGNLANLEHLDLAGNLLTGSIPEELGEINRLRHINLGQNLLEGTIPFEALARTSLETLILHENQLFGSLPTQIGKLGRLAHLDLHANAISGSIPAQLGSLRSLRFLNLGANQFSGTIPKNLGNLVKLQQLRAQQKPVVGRNPASAGQFCPSCVHCSWRKTDFRV